VFVTSFVLLFPSSNKSLNLNTTPNLSFSPLLKLKLLLLQSIVALVIFFSSLQARAQAQLPPWSFSLSSPQTQVQVLVTSVIFFPFFELEPKLP
jgi:hypothetical protein